MTTMEETELVFDLTVKKKKKKKKTPEDFEQLSDAAAPVAEEEPAAPTAAPAVAAAVDEAAEPDLSIFLPKKKKKKKKKGDGELGGNGDLGGEPAEAKEDGGDAGADEAEVEAEQDYSYEFLLDRVFDIIKATNPKREVGETPKFVLKPPQVSRIGTKKTSFVNFTEICKLLHRQPKHLLAFVCAELGTSGSVDANNQLIIRGRYQQKQIESLLRRYIKEYVTCHTCKAPETILQKETRLFFLQCEKCHSRCSVATIKSGFQAVTGKRAAQRAKQG